MRCDLVGWHTHEQCLALDPGIDSLGQTVILMHGLVRHDGNISFTDHTNTGTTAAFTQIRWTV